MRSLFVDTNIVLDLLSKRKPHYYDAAKLFSLADKQQIELAVSSLTFVNAHYILCKEMSDTKARAILRRFKILVKVLPLDDKIIDLSLNADFADFEDAIQYFTALESQLEIIITRNIKDFKLSEIPVMTAGEYLNSTQKRK